MFFFFHFYIGNVRKYEMTFNSTFFFVKLDQYFVGYAKFDSKILIGFYLQCELS